MSGETTTPRPGPNQRRDLVAQRLAAARRHQHERVAVRRGGRGWRSPGASGTTGSRRSSARIASARAKASSGRWGSGGGDFRASMGMSASRGWRRPGGTSVSAGLARFWPGANVGAADPPWIAERVRPQVPAEDAGRRTTRARSATMAGPRAASAVQNLRSTPRPAYSSPSRESRPIDLLESLLDVPTPRDPLRCPGCGAEPGGRGAGRSGPGDAGAAQGHGSEIERCRRARREGRRVQGQGRQQYRDPVAGAVGDGAPASHWLPRATSPRTTPTGCASVRRLMRPLSARAAPAFSLVAESAGENRSRRR